MRIRFTKMQGAGNDFVVLDETRGPLGLGAAQYRFLADRHFGVGCDQILSVRPAPSPEVDFAYAIHNADGGEVGQCGNGSRCFLKFVLGRGLTTKERVRVATTSGVLEPRLAADGGVTVDMGAPVFERASIPFTAAGWTAHQPFLWRKAQTAQEKWTSGAIDSIAVLSMGNPHAVLLVPDVDAAPVRDAGCALQADAAFPKSVNVGFMQVTDRANVRLRVYERGAGETLSCGSGACAAVVAGVRLGLLDGVVTVSTRGGPLVIEWAGADDSHVFMTGPATTVFDGEIDIPDHLR